MFKKYYKYIFVVLLLFPMIVSATTYSVAKTSANEYYKRVDYEGKYFRLDVAKYGFTSSGITLVSGFNTGGLLNELEYKISKSGTSRSSYLAPGNYYWIMPKGSDTYVLGTSVKDMASNSNVPNTRVVEYIRHGTRASGKGSMDKPWIFEEAYKVNVTVKNKTGGTVAKEVQYISKKGNATFNYTLDAGYSYGTIDCEGIESGTTVSKDAGNSVTIRNITSNIDCKILFKK